MRSRRPTAEHQETVARRLALLSAELASSRPAEAVAESELDELDESPDWWVDHTRITPPPRELRREPPEPVLGDPPAVPVPGRHAARRAGRVLADSLPTTLRGRVALGPGQVAVIAVLVAVGLAVTCWWVVRGDPTVIAPVSAASSSSSPLVGLPSPASATGATTGTTTGTGPGGASGDVTVDVAGKVRRPGIAVLDAGSRVVDALAAAGGARRGVDLSEVNLARVLVDGEQILVGLPAPVGAAASAVSTPGSPGGPLVDLNTASQAELETLPEVGPVTATAILAWRDEHGGFSSVDELLEVDGIGDATLGQIAPYVTV
ncbi:helix-hairpin-helix domain-containing protein [Nocardioides sp.]|uniref:ComEA family DNA-binding protein n=1 Tax=Nocardioides sp. TaxID=35761 RepID=UPI0031FF05AF|nr:competence protein ComEA helix-hairpin-helix repeat protein [Nocardioides sp.]